MKMNEKLNYCYRNMRLLTCFDNTEYVILSLGNEFRVQYCN